MSGRVFPCKYPSMPMIPRYFQDDFPAGLFSSLFRSRYPDGVLFVATFVVFVSKPKAWIIRIIKNV